MRAKIQLSHYELRQGKRVLARFTPTGHERATGTFKISGRVEERTYPLIHILLYAHQHYADRNSKIRLTPRFRRSA